MLFVCVCVFFFPLLFLYFYNMVSLMSTIGIGINNLHIASFEVTSQKSFFILIRILVVKSVTQVVSRCSDITVCTVH
jgi:hypothetical protein